MDPLRLLSRSTKRPRNDNATHIHRAPSSGHHGEAQALSEPTSTTSGASRKRKRAQASTAGVNLQEPPDFFGQNGLATDRGPAGSFTGSEPGDVQAGQRGTGAGNVRDARLEAGLDGKLPLPECRRLLQQNKLKVTWLNPPRKSKKQQKVTANKVGGSKVKDSVYPQPLLSFDALKARHGIGSRLARNIVDQGYKVPTEVQLAALPLLLDAERAQCSTSTDDGVCSGEDTHGIDLLSVAPTGSGKTLAFMIPLVEASAQHRRTAENSERRTSAIILAPTKELAAQIVNEGRKLARDTGVKVTQMRKGMKFGREQSGDAPTQPGTAPSETPNEDHVSIVKADIVVSTPGLLQSALLDCAHHLSQVRNLVLDEADVLLDPLFKSQTLDIWNSLAHPFLRVSMWSATMGSNIEQLALTTIAGRRRQLEQDRGESIPEAPLLRLIVGLKDSAAPNVEHKLIYAATEQGKLMGLRQLLHPTSSSVESGPMLRPPFLVFTQTIERAVALHSELRYDIPAEAGGVSRIAVLHADLSSTTRDDVMTRFRKGSIWILITTDLLSRGVDFRGVNGVVNYDIPGSSAAYIHRIGRTGRAGREGGVAVTLYTKEDMPYLKHIANVVSMAERNKGGEGNGVQQWLLDALPKLSKNEKQALKKHGVRSRTTKGTEADSKASKKTKISTKPGFMRQAENRRKGAIIGSQRRQQAQSDSEPDAVDDTEFAGFD